MALLHDAVKFLLYAYPLYVAVLCTDMTSTVLAFKETVCYHNWIRGCANYDATCMILKASRPKTSSGFMPGLHNCV